MFVWINSCNTNNNNYNKTHCINQHESVLLPKCFSLAIVPNRVKVINCGVKCSGFFKCGDDTVSTSMQISFLRRLQQERRSTVAGTDRLAVQCMYKLGDRLKQFTKWLAPFVFKPVISCQQEVHFPNMCIIYIIIIIIHLLVTAWSWLFK